MSNPFPFLTLKLWSTTFDVSAKPSPGQIEKLNNASLLVWVEPIKGEVKVISPHDAQKVQWQFLEVFHVCPKNLIDLRGTLGMKSLKRRVQADWEQHFGLLREIFPEEAIRGRPTV